MYSEKHTYRKDPILRLVLYKGSFRIKEQNTRIFTQFGIVI